MLYSTADAGPLIDMPFVYCFEERANQSRLFDLLDAHSREVLTVHATFSIYYVRLEFFVLDFPFYSLTFNARIELQKEDS